MTQERLQKILARAGVASRRACEEVIADGRVTVDGQTVQVLGTKADPEAHDIRLDGKPLRAERLEYWLLNKPKGVVCTNRDPAGRRRPVDLIPGSKARLFPVGRLDAESKGLLILTNDGALANRLTHPRYEVPKTYRAIVAGHVTAEDVRRLVRGVYLPGGRTQRAKVEVLKRGRSRSILQITIREGRNRQIRRVLARLRHPVRELVRTRLGRLSLRGLGAGKARRLTSSEVEYLKGLPDQAPPDARAPVKRGGPRRPPRRRASTSKNPLAKAGSKRPGRRTKKRSTHPNDSDGTGKARPNHRRGPKRGGGRSDRPRKPSATRRRRTRGDSPQ